ncbi:MAG: stage III sporulation protein AF [Lachnospiraceae bacterium]|nr:stage III sporulation protein AF [Lachnospiraceae bacterium]
MTQAVYQWVRNLAVYYIILTALMHIMPNSQYGRYIRYFMGILLILILASPLFNLLHLEERMNELFHKKMLEEEFWQPQWGQMQEEAQAQEYYMQAYEQEVADRIRESLDGILGEACKVLEVRVHMEIEGESGKLCVGAVQIWLSGAENQWMRERVENELGESYEITRERLELFFEEMG